MYGAVDVDRVWSARASLDFAMEALAHAHPSGWEGSAARAAQGELAVLLARAWDVRDDLHQMAQLLEEAEMLRQAALLELL